MSLVSLSDVVGPALRDGYAVAGMVCLGWEDARAYAHAAQAEGAPVILQAGPGCRKHTPLPVLAAMFRSLAQSVDVPVVAHLDHGYTPEECDQAIDCGFTSVMFDGSKRPIDENIEISAKIAERAHAAGVSLEGEIGFVGYDQGEASAATSPGDAKAFASQSGVDAMAVSIGNVHLQQQQAASLDEPALRAIEAVCDLPLVIHGGSGVPSATRHHLATTSKICKFNIGTELRMGFGAALRTILQDNPTMFDRVEILKRIEAPLIDKARAVIQTMGGSNRYR